MSFRMYRMDAWYNDLHNGSTTLACLSKTIIKSEKSVTLTWWTPHISFRGFINYLILCPCVRYVKQHFGRKGDARSASVMKKRHLTHWGRVTHICISKLTIIGSDDGVTPSPCQAIIWTTAGISLIGSLGTNFSEIFIEIYTFSFKKIHLKTSSPQYANCWHKQWRVMRSVAISPELSE